MLTKWTAVKPVAKQKQFLVSWVIQPALPTNPIELVELEGVFSKATQASLGVNCRMTVCGGRVGFDGCCCWSAVLRLTFHSTLPYRSNMHTFQPTYFQFETLIKFFDFHPAETSKMKILRWLALTLLGVSGFSAAQNSPTKEIQEIEFRSLNPRQYEDVVQEKWREITVKGKLFVPNNPISPKAPAMIVLHGSGGISDGRELTYGEKFNNLGMYALVIDSYLSRGVEKMPHARRLFEISPFAQAADAIAGLNHIAGINEIDESKIGVIGFSFGGVTSYYLNLDNITSKISRTKNKFAANISLYGGCQFSFETPRLTEIPFLLVVGEKDESLDLEVCKKKFNNLNKNDPYSKFLIIPNAHHAWEVNSPLSFRKTINLRDCYAIFTDKGLMLTIRNDGVMAPFSPDKPAGFGGCIKPGYTIGKNTIAEKIADDYIKNFLLEVFK